MATEHPTFQPLPGVGARVVCPNLPDFIHRLNSTSVTVHTTLFTDALTEHAVLIFPNMATLTPVGHLHFTSIFGQPQAHPCRGQPPSLPCLDNTDCLVEVATNDTDSKYCSTQVRAARVCYAGEQEDAAKN